LIQGRSKLAVTSSDTHSIVIAWDRPARINNTTNNNRIVFFIPSPFLKGLGRPEEWLRLYQKECGYFSVSSSFFVASMELINTRQSKTRPMRIACPKKFLCLEKKSLIFCKRGIRHNYPSILPATPCFSPK
jgi:hypothetical protein